MVDAQALHICVCYTTSHIQYITEKAEIVLAVEALNETSQRFRALKTTLAATLVEFLLFIF